MYEIKISDFSPKQSYSRDLSYLVTFFRQLGVEESETSLLFPDSVLTPIEPAPMTKDIYTYFLLAWPNEEKVVDLSKVVGSHDERNINNKNWLQNFLYDPPTKEQCDIYIKKHLDIFLGHEHMPCLFSSDNHFYLADGHHRFSTFFLHYQIAKSKHQNIDTHVKAHVRVIPKNLDFVRRFNEFCLINHLYYEDEEGVLANFEIVDSNPDYPVLRYTDSDITINPDSNLDEVLDKIKNIPNKEGDKYVP